MYIINLKKKVIAIAMLLNIFASYFMVVVLLLRMARSIDSIKDITDLKELWKLAVRVEDLCLWYGFSKSKEEHLEFILLDK
jgi:hypothetical protein